MEYISSFKKCFVLLTGWMICLNSLAQDQVNVSLEIHIECPDRMDPRLNLKDLEFQYYNYSNEVYYGGRDYRTYDEYSCNFLKGVNNKFRVVAKPKPGTESTILPYIIREIQLVQMAEDARTDVGNPIIYNVQKKDITLDINLPSLRTNARYYKLKIFVERCQEEGAVQLANVKVMATIANRPDDLKNEYNFSAPDMHVEIGDKLVAFDEDGIGWVRIRPDQYKIAYSRFLSKAGIVTLKSSKTGKTEELTTTVRNAQNSDNSNINECVVPLLKENSNSGNLYDYELKICMLKDPPDYGRGSQLVLSDFKPIVDYHKEAAPDEEWLPVEKGMVLTQGDEISCDPDGIATLRFLDNSTVDLKHHTLLKIASYFTEGGVIRVEILLKMGEVAAKVNRSDATKSDFCIKTTTATISVRGTEYSVRYDPTTQLTTVWVDQGKVKVTPTNTNLAPILLTPGQQVTVDNYNISNVTGISANKPTTSSTFEPKPGITPTTTTTSTMNIGNAPSWSRGEQLLYVSFDEAMKRGEAALKSEGFVNLQKQANFVAGYKGDNTAIIMCNNAPNGNQWINIVVGSLTNDGNVPGAERVKLQKQMEVVEVFNSTPKEIITIPSAKAIDWYGSPTDLRGKNNQRFTFTCPVNDYPGHRLYGTDVYTDDSSICTAAVHAGAIPLSGGTVTIEILGPMDSYSSSTRNGIHSDGYGYWPGSFKIIK